MQFGDGFAIIADQEDCHVLMAPMATRNIGVQALNLVGEPHFQKEFKRAINGRWLGCAFAVKALKQVVGLRGLAVFQHEAENLATDLCQTRAACFAYGFCFIQSFIDISRSAIKM